jgi:flagellar protein FlgJ
MAEFLGGAEITARTEMLGITNKLQDAQIAAAKTKEVNKTAYLQSIKNVSKQFESIFLGYMLQQMRKTVPEDPIFGNSAAKNIFSDMHDEALSKEMANAGGIGLAAMLYKQLASEGIKLDPGAVVKQNTDISI